MIADIGYERTNITVVDGGIPYLHRSVQMGGFNVTQAISKQMSVSFDKAEQIKKDLAKSRADKIPPVLKQALEPLLHELKYTLDLYKGQEFHNFSTVDKIILTGGSAALPYIDPFLTEGLNINVYIGDPWARVAVPAGIRPLLQEIGPRFAVPVGLAMRLNKKEK